MVVAHDLPGGNSLDPAVPHDPRLRLGQDGQAIEVPFGAGREGRPEPTNSRRGSRPRRSLVTVRGRVGPCRRGRPDRPLPGDRRGPAHRGIGPRARPAGTAPAVGNLLRGGRRSLPRRAGRQRCLGASNRPGGQALSFSRQPAPAHRQPADRDPDGHGHRPVPALRRPVLRAGLLDHGPGPDGRRHHHLDDSPGVGPDDDSGIHPRRGAHG